MKKNKEKSLKIILKMQTKGKFIVFEGIDGCGKTTQLLKFVNFLAETDKYKKLQLVLAKEPTYDSKAGLLLRKKLAEEEDPKKEGRIFCQLMVRDRAEHCKNLIEPALKHGCIVFCDRYSHSTFAFQQAQGIDFNRILAEHRKYRILKPDLTLIFDVPAQTAFKRIEKTRAKKYLFEKTKFLEIVRQNYLKLKKFLPNENIVIIDASKPIEKIFKEVKAIIEKVL